MIRKKLVYLIFCIIFVGLFLIFTVDVRYSGGGEIMRESSTMKGEEK